MKLHQGRCPECGSCCITVFYSTSNSTPDRLVCEHCGKSWRRGEE